MKLGLNDLHNSVGDILKARMWTMRFGHNMRPEDAGVRRVLTRGWKGWGRRVLTAIPIGALVGAGVAAALGGNGGAIAGAAFMTAYFGGIGTAVGSVLQMRFARNQAIDAEELRAISTGLQLGEPETVYLDTVCALMEAGENVSDQTGHEILGALSDLLEQARYVNERLERLRSAASTESVQDLEKERERLAARIEQVNDPQGKTDLTHGLSMCDDRLGNARTLAPLIERLDAQREVIHQTLLSVQSSVSRLQVAPAAIAAPDVEEVKRVLGQVTTQTQAVEDAVQEVIALRS